MIKDKIYNVGIYTRLSQDDARMGESMSIENQKNILAKYAQDENLNVKFTYADDGYTGTNFERPDFKQMLEDIKTGEINLVLVKDLSRIGRDHVRVGEFIEDILPAFGCSIVAINNNVDTRDKNNSNNEMMGFVNLFNEFHSRETSKKVRQSKKSCAERGMFLGTYAPFGYRKSKDDRHTLEIDEQTAPIVQRMFEMRSKGTSYRSIATTFNEEKVIAPREVYYQNKKAINPQNNNGLWNAATIRQILRSEVYIGNMIQGKVGTLSYKNKKVVKKDESEWIRVENTHEPIIDIEVWQKVVDLNKRNYQPKKGKTSPRDNIFVGLVYCADCGYTMRYQVSKEKRKDNGVYEYTSFLCGNYSRSGKSACTTHTISEKNLKEIVLEEIHSLARLITHDEDAIVKRLMKLKNKEASDKAVLYKTQLKNNQKRIAELETFTQKLYEDRISGAVNEQMFQRLMNNYDSELTAKTEATKELTELLTEYENQTCNVTQWTKAIKKYLDVTELDKSMLLELIDKIEVYEPEKIGNKRICSIKIIYRMVGDITKLSESEVISNVNTTKEAV